VNDVNLNSPKNRMLYINKTEFNDKQIPFP